MDRAQLLKQLRPGAREPLRGRPAEVENPASLKPSPGSGPPLFPPSSRTHTGLQPDRRWLSCRAAFSGGGTSRGAAVVPLLPPGTQHGAQQPRYPHPGVTPQAPGPQRPQHDLATSISAEAAGSTSVLRLQLTPGTTRETDAGRRALWGRGGASWERAVSEQGQQDET